MGNREKASLLGAADEAFAVRVFEELVARLEDRPSLQRKIEALGRKRRRAILQHVASARRALSRRKPEHRGIHVPDSTAEWVERATREPSVDEELRGIGLTRADRLLVVKLLVESYDVATGVPERGTRLPSHERAGKEAVDGGPFRRFLRRLRYPWRRQSQASMASGGRVSRRKRAAVAMAVAGLGGLGIGFAAAPPTIERALTDVASIASVASVGASFSRGRQKERSDPPTVPGQPDFYMTAEPGGGGVDRVTNLFERGLAVGRVQSGEDRHYVAGQFNVSPEVVSRWEREHQELVEALRHIRMESVGEEELTNSTSALSEGDIHQTPEVDITASGLWERMSDEERARSNELVEWILDPSKKPDAAGA